MNWRSISAVMLGVVLALAGTAGQEPGGGSDIVPGEVIVKYRPGASATRRAAIAASRAARLVVRYNAVEVDHLRLPAGIAVLDAVEAFRRDPDVELAQPNYVRRVTASPPSNDPFWLDDTLWGLRRIQAQRVWTTWSTGDGSVVVANIDTGVNYNHPDLAANMWRNPGEIPGNLVDDDGNGYVDDVFGIDAVNNDSDPMDDHGHGTHTAGTHSAVGDNGIGVVGVTWNTKILACKFLSASGNGNDAGAIACFNYIRGMKQRGVNIRVSNNSWGAPRGAVIPAALQSAIDAAGNAGILNVFAAGNEGADNDVTPHDPASLPSPSIVSVAASDGADNRASFSNYGASSVDLAAPGVGIASTVGSSGYGGSNGTSMAAPHVAGAAALLASVRPELTRDGLKSLLLDHVDPLAQWQGITVSGGRLNVFEAAFAAVGPTPPEVTLTSPVAGATATAPGAFTVAATATDAEGVAEVRFYANGDLIGLDDTSPYVIAWSGVAAGSYTLTAVATDTLGTTGASSPIAVTVDPGSTGGGTSAAFVGVDTTTRGNWIGQYGGDGYSLVDDATSLPAYAQLGVSGAAQWTWAGSTSDPRALQRAGGTGRLAATWYGTAFTFDVNLTDGQPHQVSLYMLDWDTTSRQQRVDVVDAVTQQVLDTRTVSGFNGGQYLIWTLSGHVTIRVSWLGGWNAVASGIFFGSAGPPNTPPTALLTSPVAGATFTAPATIGLAATAADTDGIAQVAFYANGNLIGTDATAPYELTWPNVAAAVYALTAVATDTRGATGSSDPVNVTVSPPAGGGGTSAVFVGLDTTTQGNWLGQYGADGHSLVDDVTSLPAYAQLGVTGAAQWTWSSATSDVRALQRASGNGRLAATWYGSAFSFDVNLTDGQPHQVALYFLDWDTTSRQQRVDVIDAASQQVLDTRTVTAFSGGQYLVWTLSGHVEIRVSRLEGVNAVASALFFGSAGAPNTPPAVSLTSPAAGATFTAPAAIDLAAAATDADGIAQVAFYANGGLLGVDTTSPFEFAWENVAAGSYALTAVATDGLGGSGTSAAVNVTVSPPGGGTAPSAVFVALDETTQGNWIGQYGADGYSVVDDATSLPAFVQMAVSGALQWTWASATPDPRALQRAGGNGRLAATWYGETFSIDLDFTDGQPHRVGIYCVDFDGTSREQRIDVLDSATLQVLDSRTLTDFNGGRYVVWDVNGQVTIRVTRLSGWNAVVSGVFFSGPDGPSDR